MLISQVCIGVGIMRDDQGIAFVNQLDGFLAASQNGDNFIGNCELGGAEFVTLRNDHNGCSVETTVVNFFELLLINNSDFLLINKLVR